MLYIDNTDKKVIETRKKHFNAIHCRISRKLKNIHCLNEDCEICNSRQLKFKSTKQIQDKVIDFIFDSNNLEILIIGMPYELVNLSNDFFKAILPQIHFNNLEVYFDSSKKVRRNKYKIIYKLFSDIEKIFDYDDWLSTLEPNSQYSLYELAKNLNRRTCTYCNRVYTTTLTTNDNKKLMRPQFDHWFPQSKFPLLALSFYNLIPSCSICNSSSKLNITLNTNSHIHPYIDKTQTEDFTFNYIHHNVDKYHIFIHSNKPDNKALKTLKTLSIDRMYNSQIEELEDLIKIKKAYGDSYIKRLQKLFPKAGLNKKEIYQLMFGVEYEASDFHKRPLSKFKSDILKKLEII